MLIADSASSLMDQLRFCDFLFYRLPRHADSRIPESHFSFSVSQPVHG